LYEQGLTFRQAKIEFFVDKQDEKILRMNAMLEEIEEKTPVMAGSDGLQSQ